MRSARRPELNANHLSGRFDLPGMTEILRFVKPAPIDQEAGKKAKKQQAGGKKKKQEGAEPNLPDAMESMRVHDS